MEEGCLVASTDVSRKSVANAYRFLRLFQRIWCWAWGCKFSGPVLQVWLSGFNVFGVGYLGVRI